MKVDFVKGQNENIQFKGQNENMQFKGQIENIQFKGKCVKALLKIRLFQK